MRGVFLFIQSLLLPKENELATLVSYSLDCLELRNLIRIVCYRNPELFIDERGVKYSPLYILQRLEEIVGKHRVTVPPTIKYRLFVSRSQGFA